MILRIDQEQLCAIVAAGLDLPGYHGVRIYQERAEIVQVSTDGEGLACEIVFDIREEETPDG